MFKRLFPLLAFLAMAPMLLPISARGGTWARFKTAYGDVDIELFDQDKPITVRNFIRLVQAGAYQNMFFHRCDPHFVVQGGGFSVADTNDPGVFNRFWEVPHFGEITNEYQVGRTFSNVYGTLAMAKVGGKPNSATSQWFFNLNHNTFLDSNNGGFTVFGRVLQGTNALNHFNNIETNNGLVNLQQWYGPAAAAFSELPVKYLGNTPPKFTDLEYVDIQLLPLKIARTSSGARLLAWPSVAGRVNTIEYSSQWPPQWSVLRSVTGNGNEMTFEDATSITERRFYRVAITY